MITFWVAWFSFWTIVFVNGADLFAEGEFSRCLHLTAVFVAAFWLIQLAKFLFWLARSNDERLNRDSYLRSYGYKASMHGNQSGRLY